MSLKAKVSIEFRPSSAFLRVVVVVKITMKAAAGAIISALNQRRVDTATLWEPLNALLLCDGNKDLTKKTLIYQRLSVSCQII